MRIDLVLLGLLIAIKTGLNIIELNVFLIQCAFTHQFNLMCFKHKKAVADFSSLKLKYIYHLCTFHLQNVHVYLKH